MSLQSLPVKEFCHEINFLLSTQASGDTDKMLTCKRDCISTNPTIIIILIFDKLFYIYFTFMNVLIRLMRHYCDEIWNLKIIISSKRDILPNFLIITYNVIALSEYTWFLLSIVTLEWQFPTFVFRIFQWRSCQNWNE